MCHWHRGSDVDWGDIGMWALRYRTYVQRTHLMPELFIFEKKPSSLAIYLKCCGLQICNGYNLPEMCHLCLGRVSRYSPACICEEFTEQLEVLQKSNHSNMMLARLVCRRVLGDLGHKVCSYLIKKTYLYDGNLYKLDLFDTGRLRGVLHGSIPAVICTKYKNHVVHSAKMVNGFVVYEKNDDPPTQPKS